MVQCYNPLMNPNKPLVPKWAWPLLALVLGLATSAWLSPDMRAVYVAAWAACF